MEAAAVPPQAWKRSASKVWKGGKNSRTESSGCSTTQHPPRAVTKIKRRHNLRSRDPIWISIYGSIHFLSNLYWHVHDLKSTFQYIYIIKMDDT